MKLFWTGTDSLMMIDLSKRKRLRTKVYYLVMRVMVKLIEPFIECHYAVSEKVADNIKKFGVRKEVIIRKDFILNPGKVQKMPHSTFNVVSYFPKYRADREFTIWLYGRDIVQKVAEMMPDCNFIEIDGTHAMHNIYAITDFYLRPNRHDGHSRIIDECELNEIPYYWSITDPNIDDIIDAIKRAIYNKMYGE